MSEFIIKEIIKYNATFEYYRAQTLYYSVYYQGEKYIFPIDIDDVGGGTLEGTMKAITLMRWIRLAIENNTFIKVY